MRPLASPRARELVERFQQTSVAIVGDIMLDQFMLGRVSRISPEAPVPVVQIERDEYRLGGAANVASNVRALGGCPALFGAIGRDDPADRILEALRRVGDAVDGIVLDRSRPTTVKMRIVADRHQQVARLDRESTRPLDESVEVDLLARLRAGIHDAHVLVVSDYLKGTITESLMREVLAVARERGISVLVDPKVPHLQYYRGATLVTPNHHEAEKATGRSIETDADAGTVATELRQTLGCGAVLITRGEHGMCLLDGTGLPLHIPTVARSIYDVTGAGDTVIATMALSVAAGGSMAEAAALANHAAGIVVEKFATASVSAEELLAACEQE